VQCSLSLSTIKSAVQGRSSDFLIGKVAQGPASQAVLHRDTTSKPTPSLNPPLPNFLATLVTAVGIGVLLSFPSLPFKQPAMAASESALDPFFKGEGAVATRTLLRVLILVLIAAAAVSARLFSVIRFESIIHEFDPWFNFRATYVLPTRSSVVDLVGRGRLTFGLRVGNISSSMAYTNSGTGSMIVRSLA
jgi:hypothetical protein